MDSRLKNAGMTNAGGCHSQNLLSGTCFNLRRRIQCGDKHQIKNEVNIFFTELLTIGSGTKRISLDCTLLRYRC